MSDSSRRAFLTTAGLTTAAGVAAVAAPQAAAAEDVTVPADAHGPMAAYIHDVRKGEVALMIEGREVIVSDKRLVAQLARAFERAGRG